jgi:hypothetical protein
MELRLSCEPVDGAVVKSETGNPGQISELRKKKELIKMRVGMRKVRKNVLSKNWIVKIDSDK